MTNDSHLIWDFGLPRAFKNDASEIWGAFLNDDQVFEGVQTPEEIMEDITAAKEGKRDKRVGPALRNAIPA